MKKLIFILVVLVIFGIVVVANNRTRILKSKFNKFDKVIITDIYEGNEEQENENQKSENQENEEQENENQESENQENEEQVNENQVDTTNTTNNKHVVNYTSSLRIVSSEANKNKLYDNVYCMGKVKDIEPELSKLISDYMNENYPGRVIVIIYMQQNISGEWYVGAYEMQDLVILSNTYFKFNILDLEIENFSLNKEKSEVNFDLDKIISSEDCERLANVEIVNNKSKLGDQVRGTLDYEYCLYYNESKDLLYYNVDIFDYCYININAYTGEIISSNFWSGVMD